MSNPIRLTGIASGMDTETLIKQLMNVGQMRVDRVKQDKQYTEWKIEEYRNVINDIRALKDEFFDFLSPENNLRSSKTFNTYKVNFDGADTSRYLDITANYQSPLSDNNILEIGIAKAAKLEGQKLISSDITGNIIADLNITSISNNNKIKVNFNGVSKEITIDDNPSSVNDIVNDLSTKLEDAFGTGKISVLEVGGALKFSVSDTDEITISEAYNKGNEIFIEDISGGIDITGDNNRFSLTLDDGTTPITKAIVLSTGQYNDPNTLVSEIQTKIDGSFGNGKINVKYENNKISLETVNTDDTVTINKQKNNGIDFLGLTNVSLSNKVDLNTNLSEISTFFNTDLITQDSSGDGNDIEFKINGETFKYDSTITSLNDIINDVNSNNNANVNMRYDEINDKFIIENKSTGLASGLEIEDVSGEGNFMQTLGLIGNAIGSDAYVIFEGDLKDDGTREPNIRIERPTNNFNIDGLTFKLKENFSGDMNISISNDTEKAKETIVSFIEKYNEFVDKISTKLSEKRYRDYKPLTEDQRKDMEEKEIELWEEKAKSGILGRENTLDSMLSEMRRALYESVDGAGISLKDMGIETSSDYKERGKLVIKDQEKLDKVLSEDSDKIVSLFTSNSDNYSENGIANRLYDIIEKNIATTGEKGILLKKAGLEGDRTEFDNFLNDRVKEYDDRIEDLVEDLARQEDYYYNMFAKMEEAINRMNQQSAWIMSQMGGGMQY